MPFAKILKVPFNIKMSGLLVSVIYPISKVLEPDIYSMSRHQEPDIARVSGLLGSDIVAMFDLLGSDTMSCFFFFFVCFSIYTSPFNNFSLLNHF